MTLRRAAIVAPIRTAVGKFGGALSSMSAGELGAVILKALVERSQIDPSRVDDVVFSQGYGNGEAPAIGHWSWLAAGNCSTPGRPRAKPSDRWPGWAPRGRKRHWAS